MQPGIRLGPYEIVGVLGAGGMGEVYRARDTRLGRDVAIKVLPPELTADTERLRRFEQEARTVSSLNHPNIVTLHEIGSTPAGPYLVLEMVEGKSLREALGGGPLPIRRVLAIGAQVAEGLAKAHAAGIVHRDLKPENVMLSADGFAKILDFGLARLAVPEAGAARTDLPTVAAHTGSGQILGTVGYMSPEQAAGQRVDPRSDQFALGALLYELSTGTSPFRRATAAETMVAVMREEVPPLRDARPEAPAQLSWIIERCLAKDPEERYAATRDLARDLGDLRDRLSEITRTGDASLPRPRSWRTWRESAAWTIAVLALVAAALAFATGGTPGDGPGPSYRPLTFQRGPITGARFAPDGRTIYYSAAFGAEPSRLFVTHLDGSGSAPLDMPTAILQSVSRKGELAIVLTDAKASGVPGTLARIPALGGTPRALAEGVLYADWAPDGENLAVDTRGPTEFPLGRPLPTGSSAGFVRVSPAGDMLALIDDGLRIIDTSGLEVVRQPMRLIYGLAWHPSGREVWFTGSETGGGDRALWALSLDGELELLLRVPGALTLHDVGPDGNTALLSTGGGILSITGVMAGAERSFDLYGRTYLAGMTGDGRLLARETREVGFGAYLLSIDSGRQLLLGADIALGISPDGAHVLVRNRDNPGQLALVPTGAGPVEDLPVGDLEAPFETRARWSADGRRLFAALRTRGDLETLRVYLFEPGGTWQPVTPAIAGLPFAVSPDGNHVAARGSDGVVSIHQVDGAPARRLEGERGYPLHWSDDGAWLFLRRDYGLPVAEVYRLEVASGRTESWRTLGPADPTGVFGIGEVAIAGNGEAFAFGVQRGFHELFLVEGIR